MLESQEITAKQLLEEIVRNRNEIKIYIDTLEAKQQQKIQELNKKVEVLEQENKQLKNELEESRRIQLKNNTVVFGLGKREKLTTSRAVCEELNGLLNINLGEQDIGDFYFLGRDDDSPLKIVFARYISKKLVIGKKKSLKGSQINIADDLTLQQRQQNQILRKHQALAKKKGKSNCYIKNGRLFINEESYGYENLLELEKEVEAANSNSASSSSTSANKKQPPPEYPLENLSKIQYSSKKADNPTKAITSQQKQKKTT